MCLCVRARVCVKPVNPCPLVFWSADIGCSVYQYVSTYNIQQATVHRSHAQSVYIKHNANISRQYSIRHIKIFAWSKKQLLLKKAVD